MEERAPFATEVVSQGVLFAWQVNVNTTGATRTSGGSASGGWARAGAARARAGAAARWRSSRWPASAGGGGVRGRRAAGPRLGGTTNCAGESRPLRARAGGPRIVRSRPVLAACREDRSTFFYICVFLFDFRVFDFVSHRSEKILK